MSNNKAEIEILFGSESRGDADSLSDKDILIIEDSYERLDARKKVLVSQGYSVAPYTWKRFNKLVSKKSLFIQHLKQEGIILNDKNLRATSVLSSFCPKPSYEDEINENERLFSIVEKYPNTTKGMLWVADVLYVSLRNFGVLSLANDGVYRFSYERIIDELIARGDFSLSERSSLIKLRWMKSLYRRSQNVPKSEIEKIILLASMAIQKISCARPAGVSPLNILQEIASSNEHACAYERLRRIEKYYLALIAVNPKLECNEDFKKILQAIQDPRSYAFLASQKEEEILKTFRDSYTGKLSFRYLSGRTIIRA